jgi:hypothetical protein
MSGHDVPRATVEGMVDDLIASFQRRAGTERTRQLANAGDLRRRLLDRLLGIGQLTSFVDNPEPGEESRRGPA